MAGNIAGRHRQRGFTLLEIALTLLIASILLTIVVPRLPSFGRTDLEASADRLASTMTYLAEEASLRGRIYRLTLDLEDDVWTVAAMTPLAASAAEGEEPGRPGFHEDPSDPMARGVQLPRGVFLDAVVDREGERRSGVRAVYFLPEGLPESLAVRLGEEDGASSVVRLDATRATAWRETTVETRR